MEYSKSKIDKSGRVLSLAGDIDEEYLELEDVFDSYRAQHLEPLSQLTIDLQRWLHEYGNGYYIAQRLKRKPQILRKLKRLSVRLTQLQDIGGCRIIVNSNKDVNDLVLFVEGKISSQSNLKKLRLTDYREKGRDVTGYRSVHMMIEADKRVLELQIRSRIQHYWAESIERTSVIYGRHLKEQDGDPEVISYFKELSDVFYEIESGRDPSVQSKISLDKRRVKAQEIIELSDKNKVFDSFVNEDIVKTLTSTQGLSESLNNWIIVFDWNSGDFITWESVGRNTEEAVKKYVEYENQFTSDKNYEVVMIGSSDIATVRQTHSHYFGIEKFDDILENLDQAIYGFQTRMDIDVGARQILGLLQRRKYWGKKAVSIDTLKNHYLKDLLTIDSSLKTLREKGLINNSDSPISLNVKKKAEIQSYL